MVPEVVVPEYFHCHTRMVTRIVDRDHYKIEALINRREAAVRSRNERATRDHWLERIRLAIAWCESVRV